MSGERNGNGRHIGDTHDSHLETRTGKYLELTPDLTVSSITGGIVDPITGQPLSLDEAIRSGLIDASTGEFVDPKTGRRCSLGEAVSRGLLDPQLAETLVSSCGIFDPKSGHITLLEAINKGLFDPKEKTFIDPVSGKPVTFHDAVKLGFVLQEKVRDLLDTMGPPKTSDRLTLIEAIRLKYVDVNKGTFKDKGTSVPLSRAISTGKIDIEPVVSSGLSLTDVFKQNIVNQGKVVDRNTGYSFDLSEAIERGIICPDKNEVFDENTGMKITLKEALKNKTVTNDGKYSSKATSLPLEQAIKTHRIDNPMTLKECSDFQFVDEENVFKNPVTDDSISMLSAVGIGFLDYQLKSVRDVKNGVYVSLGDALGKGIIKTDGTFVDTLTQDTMTIPEAVRKGFLTSVTQKSIFEIEGIKNPATGDYVSFNEALQLGIIDKSNCTFLDKKTMTRMMLQEAADKDFIQAQLLEMLEKPLGITVLGQELTLVQAVMNKRLDSMTGLLVDPTSKKTVPLEIAVEKKLITPMGAAVLKSLLNITVTTATVTQTVRRTIKVSPSSSSTEQYNEHSISFQEALRRGLIDETTGIYTDPDTNKEIALDEAISLGLVKIGQSSTSSTRKSSVSSVRKTSNNSTGGSSRKSSSASSRSSSPPKSLTSAKEFLKESSARESRSASLSTSIKMSSSASESRNMSANSSRKSSVSSTNSRAASRSSAISGLNGSRAGSPQKSKSNSKSSSPIKSPEKVSPPNGSKLGRLDSFESRMEERSELETFTAESKMDYSFRSEDKAAKVIPIQILSPRESSPEDDTNTEKKIQITVSSSQVSASSSSEKTEKITDNIVFDKTLGRYDVGPELSPAELMSALKQGKIHPSDIMVDDPKSGTKVDIMEAMSKGLINKSTGEYSSQTGKMNILQAMKVGAVAIVGAPLALAAAPVVAGKMAYDKIKSSTAGNQERHGQDVMSVEIDTMKGGTIHARIVESGVTTTKISSFTVEVPGTGEDISLEEAVKRGLISEETARQYKEEVTTDRTVESMMVLIIDPNTGEEIPADEAVRRGIVTNDDVEEFVRMREDRNSRMSAHGSINSLNSSPLNVGVSRSSSRMTQNTDKERASRMTAAVSNSSASGSRASSPESLTGDSKYSSTLTVDINKKSNNQDFSMREVESSTHTVTTKIVNLKQGYALSNFEEVRNLQTGETMSIYEAKLRGIATDIQGNREEIVSKQVKLFVNEAISRNLINFSSGMLTNPATGQSVTIADAIKSGLLITDFKEMSEETYIDLDADKISAGDAFVHLFDVEQKTFYRKSHNRSYTLKEAVEEDWINGDDIIFDVSSSEHQTIKEAMEKNTLNGTNCDYTIKETQKTMFIGDAAKQGFVALFPETCFEDKKQPKYTGRVYTLREAVDEGIYQTDTGLFFVNQTEECVTVSQALKMGLLDAYSAEIRNTSKGTMSNLNISVQTKVLHHSTCKVLDLAQHTELNLLEAYERGLVRDVTKEIQKPSSPFESIGIWEAIENEQLDTHTGLFFSTHEEGKRLTLEEAIFRKYICKKSAFIIDTWKRKFCSLSEATRKNIIKDGMIMNTTSGKYLRLQEAIDQQILVRDVTRLSLIQILDFGLYQPFSGKILIPGTEVEMTLSQAIDHQIIDHSKTIVKNQKSGHFVSTLESLHLGDIDGISGMYGSMNLLEARSRGYLLPIDAMVRNVSPCRALINVLSQLFLNQLHDIFVTNFYFQFYYCFTLHLIYFDNYSNLSRTKIILDNCMNN